MLGGICEIQETIKDLKGNALWKAGTKLSLYDDAKSLFFLLDDVIKPNF